MQGTKPHIIIHHTVCNIYFNFIKLTAQKTGFYDGYLLFVRLFVHLFVCSSVAWNACCCCWRVLLLSPVTGRIVAACDTTDVLCFLPGEIYGCGGGLLEASIKAQRLFFYDISYDVTISRCLSSFQYCGNNYNCCHQASRIDWNGFGIMLLNAPGDSTLQWPAERALPYLTTLVLFCVLSYHVPCMFDRSWNNQSFWRNSYQFFIIRYTRYVFCLFHW